MAVFSIRDIINKVSEGNLRIPKFQRGFVWDSESVAFLMDSIYKGYPFGTIQIWRTKEKLKTERQFGPFEIFERDADYPIDYVLDGQQRITSIFGTFQTEIELKEDIENPFEIYFDFSINEDLQESQFFSLKEDEIDTTKHFPLNCLFDTVLYRDATENLITEHKLIVDQLQEKFKEAQIPCQTLETDDRSKVAIVFERINRKGVPLDTFQLLTAWTWSESFDLQNKFENLQDDLRPFGFDDVGENINLMLRICSSILTEDSSPKALIELNGNEVRERFNEIVNGIKGAIDFVKSEFQIQKLENLPYENILVPLSVLFATADSSQVVITDEQRKEIGRWFWKTLFNKRYSAGTRKNLNRDIKEMIKLRNNEKSRLEELSYSISLSLFKTDLFNMRNVNTKTFILLLTQKRPRSFISGTEVSLNDVLQNYNRKEFHHLYPKSYLKDQKQLEYSENCLANFCIISRADNNKLGGDAPSIYRKKMPNNVDDILDSAICDTSLFKDDFDQFVSMRSLILANLALHLMDNMDEKRF